MNNTDPNHYRANAAFAGDPSSRENVVALAKELAGSDDAREYAGFIWLAEVMLMDLDD